MFKRIRDLFGRTEPQKERPGLSFDDLPSWLDAREEEIRDSLSDATASSREAINAALERLGEAISRMEEAEGAEKVHPRLRDISRKALPQFTKSMTQILSRDLSGDPEAFYATATDILKSALKTVKGQGKYLSSLYPDEMKDVRAAIRDLGRAINPMTEAVAQAQNDRQQVEGIRELHGSLIRIREEYAATSGQAQDYAATLEAVGDEIQRVEDDLAALRLRPEYARKTETLERIQELDDAEQEVKRQATSIRTTALHVFRKAGKVATKVGGDAATADFDRVLDAYASPLSENEDGLAGLTELMMPTTLTLIQQGDLVLKNQEEIALFSDPDTLPAELREIVHRRKEIQGQYAALQETYASLPIVIEEERLTTHLSELQREREVKGAARDRAESQQEILETSYAGEREKLHSVLADQEVEVDIPDLIPS